MDLDELPDSLFLFKDAGQTHREGLSASLPGDVPRLPRIEPGCRFPFLNVQVIEVDREIFGAGDVMSVVFGDSIPAFNELSRICAYLDEVVRV